jgi:hypothetical protein
LRVAFLTVLTLLSLTAAGAVLTDVAVEPVAIPTPRTVNPDLITKVGRHIGYFDTVFRGAGTIDDEDDFHAFALGLAENERLTVKSATTGPDANLWFAGTIELNQTVRSVVGRVGISGDSLVGPPLYFNVPDPEACNRLSAPCMIITGPDDAMWMTGGATGKLIRTTLTGAMSEFVISSSTIHSIASGGDGHLWVTSPTANRIFDVSPQGRVLRQFRIAPGRDFVSPSAIVALPDGTSYAFTEDGGGGNRIGVITTGGEVTEYLIPTPKSMPVALTVGTGGNIYFVELFGRKLGQLDLATGTIAEADIPNGFQPFQILTFPADEEGNDTLVLNTRDPATFDSTPQRVTIGDDEPAGGPLLSVDKIPSGTDAFVDDSDEDRSPRYVRSGDYAEFLIKVTNDGSGPATAGWHLLEKRAPGLAACQEFTSDGVNQTTREIEPNGDVKLTPKAGGPHAVLHPGITMTITVICPVMADVSGFLTNSVEVRGGGSLPVYASALVFGLTKRDADRMEEEERRPASGRDEP